MPKLRRKKTAVLFAGGTMLTHDPKPWEFVRKPADMDRWLDRLGELQVVTDLEPVFITGKQATEIGWEEWLMMAEAVRKMAGTVDGFVILHGIETLHYTANALSLMLRYLPFPVVVSGSPLRLPGEGVKQVEFEARANIINALQVATADVSGVSVVFGNRIMEASRVQPQIVDGVFQLATIDGSILGRVDFGTKLFEERPKRSSRKPRWGIHLDPNVFVTTITPGSIASSIRQSLRSTTHAILVRAHELVSLPKDVERELVRAHEQGAAIIISSRHPIPGMKHDFLSLFGVSPSMAVVKVMWALGATREPAKLRKLLEQNIAGEFIHGGPT